MQDDDLSRVCTNANPWWRNTSLVSDSVAMVSAHWLLLNCAEHDLGYLASLLGDIATDHKSTIVLTGRRRVGKSVFVAGPTTADTLAR